MKIRKNISDLAKQYLVPKRNDEMLSFASSAAGEQLIIIVVRALPPSDSCSIRVSLLSRYGMCALSPVVLRVRALITLPSADSDLLIC